MDTQKKKIVLAIFAIVVAMAVSAIAFTAYSNNPTRQAMKALAEGERYLNDLDYNEAYAYFAKAIEFAPNDEKIVASINGHIESALGSADTASSREEYERALSELDAILLYENICNQDLISRARDIRNSIVKYMEVLDAIDEAERLFNEEDYSGAYGKFNEALEKGASKDSIYPHYDLSKEYTEINTLCKAKEWENIAKHIDSNDYKVVKDNLGNDSTILIEKDLNVVLGRKDNTCYIACLSSGTGVYSGNTTFMLYDGAWNEYTPSGQGTLYIWNKTENKDDAVSFNGTFADGLIDGTAIYNSSEVQDVEVSLHNGIFETVDGIDTDAVCVSKIGNEKAYVILNEDINLDTVKDFHVGLLGFKGNDEKVLLGERTFDTTPPVFRCGLEIGTFKIVRSGSATNYTENATGYMGQNIIGYLISAVDDVDGDITSRITHTSQNSAEAGGVYQMTVVYSVSDSAGNTSKLTVVYEHHDFHGATFWNVLSIS